ncbi:MAG: hypothetical protein ACFFDH_12550, partial [Promethearchaeota archaeon]
MKNKNNCLRTINRLKSLSILLVLLILTQLFIALSLPMFNANSNNLDLDSNNKEECLYEDPYKSAIISSWWNDSWNYRVRIDIKSQERTIKNVPLEKRFNFTEFLQEFNDYNSFDFNSTRIVEYEELTQTWREIPSVTNRYIGAVSKDDYNKSSNAVVDIFWVMNGTTNKDEIRIYFVYFDSLGNGKKPEPKYMYDGAYYGFGGSQHYTPYNTENLIFRDYFRIADFSASQYRDEEEHSGNIDNPFNNVYGYPIVDEVSNYEGKVGRVKDKIDRQAHAGRDQAYSMDFYWDTPGESPHFEILKVAIRANNVSTCTALYILTDDGWKVIMYTPDAENTQGIYDAAVDKIYGCEIICDGKWRIYEYDLRHLSGTYSAWQIEFYQATTAPDSNYFWFDNMIVHQEDSETLLPGNDSYSIPNSQIYAPEIITANIKVNALDLYNNLIPNAEISIYNELELIRNGITDSTGGVSFTGINLASYNFTVSLISEIGSHIEIVNITSKPIKIIKSFQEINLTCNVSRNIFEIIDVDGRALDSGWISVGNLTNNLFNLTINNNGQAIFRWVNSTPYLYNYTVFYRDDNYNLKTITLASGEIITPNSNLKIIVNITTINFTILSYPSTAPISNAILRLYKDNSAGNSIVNLTTDQNGRAALKWLNSSGIKGNYSLKIFFWGYQKFNKTNNDFPPTTEEINFTVSSQNSYQFRIPIKPDNCKTELISLNPSQNIADTWGFQLKLRVLFNRSQADGNSEFLGPIDADSITYYIIKENFIVKSDEMVRERENKGIYQAIIDSKELESDINYIIKIKAQTQGYTIPFDLEYNLFLIKNNLILNQSENDDSSQKIYWLDNVSLSVKSYSQNSEKFLIEDDIFKNSDHSFNLSLPDISNHWNLTKIIFNIYNVTHGSFDDIELNITDPYGIKYIWNKDNVSNYYFYSADSSNGTWFDLNINLNKESPTQDNNFEFIINGSFIGSVDIVAKAYFLRDFVKIKYSKYNLTNNLTIQANYEGWSIKKITVFFQNCRRLNDWTLIDPWDDAKLNISTNERFTYSINSEGIGAGNVTINDRIIYPLNNRFIFNFESNQSIMFDTIIEIEYIQGFYQYHYLETKNITTNENDFNEGKFKLNASENSWNDQGSILIFHNLNNGTDFLSPEELAMNIKVLNNQIQGKWVFALDGFDKNVIFNASIETNQAVNFRLSFIENYIREIIYSPIGTVSYYIIELPSINGMVEYSRDLVCYLQIINTSILDPANYTIRFSVEKANYFTAIKDLNLEVLNRLTLINGTSQLGTIQKQLYALQEYNFTFLYVDLLKNYNIKSLDNKSYTWKMFDETETEIDHGQGELTFNKNNLYILDFDTETRNVGRYELNVILSKKNYNSKNAFINLTIYNAKPTFLNGSSQLGTVHKEIYALEAFNFSFSYLDVQANANITDPNIKSYSWKMYNDNDSEIDSGQGSLILNKDNLFILDFDTETRNTGRYELNVTLYKNEYELKNALINLTILSRPTLINNKSILP